MNQFNFDKVVLESNLNWLMIKLLDGVFAEVNLNFHFLKK